MEEKDKIKARALKKLDEFVIGELRYLADNNYPLKSFGMNNMLPDYFTPEEKKEVENSIQQLRDGKIESYCSCRNITIH